MRAGERVELEVALGPRDVVPVARALFREQPLETRIALSPSASSIHRPHDGLAPHTEARLRRA